MIEPKYIIVDGFETIIARDVKISKALEILEDKLAFENPMGTYTIYRDVVMDDE